jgi:hypothetical protein
MTWLAAALLALLVFVALRWRPAPGLLASVRNLAAIAPFMVALATIVITWSAWGSLDPLTTVGDEAAYVLQARLLADGRIAGDAPPIPEFFEQAHVLVEPKLAPKYPIGFGLALTPGILVGAPALIPLLLSGLTGGLIFLLCRRIYGGAVALLASTIWLAGPGGRFRSGFFSESLSGAMCLLAWYGLLRWRAERGRGWLLAVSASMAMAAITRPLTALVFALPMAVVVLHDVLRLRAWRQAGLAAAVAILIMAVLPIQNVATGGPWWELPYGRYTRAYLPFDHMGLGLDGTVPTRSRPPDLERLAQAYAQVHRDYSASGIVPALVARFRVFLFDLAGERVLPAFLLLVVGIVAGPAALRFAFGTVALLFVVHLAYAHPPQWSLYYAEALPVGAAAIAAGVAAIASRVAARLSVDRPSMRTTLLLVLASAVAIWPLPERVAATRLSLEIAREPLLRFQAASADIHTPAVIFVRYALGHRMHRSIIQNPPDYASAPVWTVYDRGDDNQRLLGVAPGRTAYLYDERWERLEQLDSIVVRRAIAP